MSQTNVLLIVLDSVRADHLSCYGHPRSTTPNLDALAGAGVRFTTALSESTWTLPAAMTLFTGLAPREHRVESHRRMPEAAPSLPALLGQAGYETFCITGNPFPRKNGMDRGFQSTYLPAQQSRLAHWVNENFSQPMGWADLGGRALANNFRSRLGRVKQPWFGLVWINDAHFPYLCPRIEGRTTAAQTLPLKRRLEIARHLRHPKHWLNSMTDEDRADLLRIYESGVTYTDYIVGRMLNDLDAQGMAGETMVVVTADHGEMLGERGLMAHGAASGVYQPLIHVPLIMRMPGLAAGVSPALVQLGDITETVARTAGVASQLAPTAMERVDLREAVYGIGRSVAFSEREPLSGKRLRREQAHSPNFDFTPHLCEMTAVVADGWKLIACSNGHEELYHLAEDPNEEHDLIGAQPQRARLLRDLKDDLHRRSGVTPTAEGLPEDDAEIVDRRLRDLGYL